MMRSTLCVLGVCVLCVFLGPIEHTQLSDLLSAPSVDAKILDRYVGRNGEPPNLILKIKREGSHLFIQENDETPQQLGAESETKFFSKSSSDSLTFELDDQGRVVRMVVHVTGRNVPLKRLD